MSSMLIHFDIGKKSKLINTNDLNVGIRYGYRDGDIGFCSFHVLIGHFCLFQHPSMRGVRICVGSFQLENIESKAFIVNILQNYEF